MKNDIIKPIIVLTVICIVASAALAATFSVADPIIRENERKAADAARTEVLAAADSFEKIEVTIEDVTEAYKAANGAGYVFTVKTKGYGGDFYVMTGIAADGTISGVKLMTNSETKGLGSRVGLPAYTDQYLGKEASLPEIQAVSGSTVSSNAFMYCVETSFAAFEEATKGV